MPDTLMIHSKKRTWLRAVMVVVLLIAVGLGSWIHFREEVKQMFVVKAVPVDWVHRPIANDPVEYEISQIIEASIGKRLGGVLGISIWSVDLGVFEQTLKSIPWISTVKVRRQLPNRVLVAVEAQRPALIVADRSARSNEVRLSAVNASGDWIAEWSNPRVLPHLPFVRGKAFVGRDQNDETSGRLRKAVIDLVQLLPNEGYAAKANIAEFSYQKGLVVSLRQPRVDILLGETIEPSELALKLSRASRVIEFLQHKKISALVLDATSVKKVVVRSNARP